MIFDPFRDGYTLTQLTKSINVLPNVYNMTSQMGMFKWVPGNTNTVTIEFRNGILGLVPTTPWGGVAPKSKPGSRSVKSFMVPHMPLEDVVLAAEVAGLRTFGGNQLEAVNTKVNDKLQVMKNKIDFTMEWRRFNALKGIVVDADGSEIENYFDAFGISPKVINFELDNPDTDVRSKSVELARYMEDHAQGESMSGIKALVSPEFFDALINHKSVKAVYSGWAEAANKLGGDLRKGFTIGGVDYSEYRANADGQRFIAEGAGHAFPMGTNDMFADMGAPADFLETVNTLALPYYSRQQNKDFNRGIDLHVQSNILPMVTRPALLVELRAE